MVGYFITAVRKGMTIQYILLNVNFPVSGIILQKHTTDQISHIGCELQQNVVGVNVATREVWLDAGLN